MDIVKLKDWVEEIKRAGGVEDGGTLDAVTAATNFCWSAYSERGRTRNEMSQLAIKWVSAFMVSCAKNGSGDDLAALMAPSKTRRAMFFREAMKNQGVLQELLREHVAAPPAFSDSAMAALGLRW